MMLTPEIILLVGSILIFFGIVISKAGFKFGVPVLLLFLFVGMLAGSDGLGIQFSSPEIAQGIGMIALCIILFSGGMDTHYSDIKPIVKEGITLATVGVLLTAVTTGAFIWWITNFTKLQDFVQFTFIESMLLASVMSSTDSASVFSILRSKSIHLKENLRPLLELESGSNDPMAYLLTILFIQMLLPGDSFGAGEAVGFFFLQFIIGAIAGLLLGKLSVWIINKINLANDGLYMVTMLVITFFIFSATTLIKGNGYLAVYIGGLVIGNAKFVHKKSIIKFYDGLTWLFQIIMFLVLGLLVNPKELLPIAVLGLIIGGFMVIFSRPISVMLSLLPFRKLSFNARAYVSWVGLRGAVPIIFATYPLVAGTPHAIEMFNIVFFITLVSLIVQGSTIPVFAKLSSLCHRNEETKKSDFGFDIEFPEEVKSAMSEVKITRDSLKNGTKLMEIPLPDKSLVVMVKRGTRFFIPRGNTHLEENDILLIITDDEAALKQTFKDLGLKGYKV